MAGTSKAETANTRGDATGAVTVDPVKEMRRLAHDLSNSLETIMQASYLLSQSKLDDTDRRWLEMVENATKDAANTSRSMREILRALSNPS